MENLDKFDPAGLDDEEYEPLADGDRMAAERAMQERDQMLGWGQEKVLSTRPSSDDEDESEEEEEEKADTGKKQTTMFSFFKKIPKPTDTDNSDTLSVAELKAKADAQAISHKLSAGSKKGSGSFEAGSLVWAKLQGYPWWPGVLCMHKEKLERKMEGVRELNVWFLGEDSRSWVAKSMIRMWGMEVDRTGGEEDEMWRKGLELAEGAVDLTQEERLKKLLYSEEDEESERNESDNESDTEDTKEKNKSPAKKRRRIMVDSDSDSDEETFEVEKILDMKEEDGTTKYLVKWLGFNKEEENTWEPLDNLDCKDKIKLFEDKGETKNKIFKDEKPEAKFSAAAC